MGAFGDELVAPGASDLPERFFDRFVFNLHPTDRTAPSILFGLGIYPPQDTVDGRPTAPAPAPSPGGSSSR